MFTRNHLPLVVTIAVLSFMTVSRTQAHFHYFMSQSGWSAGTGIHDVRIVVRQGFSWTEFGGLSLGDVFRDNIGNTSIFFGDGFEFGAEGLYYRVTSIDSANDWMEAIAIAPDTGAPFIYHQYAGPGPWMAEVVGCCRDRELSNCALSTYRCSMLIDFNFAGNDSPVLSTAPLIKCQDGGLCNYQIPAADMDPNTTLQFRFATASEYGDDCWNGFIPGMSVDQDTGMVSWNTRDLDTNPGDRWSALFVVEDLDSRTGQLKSKVCVDTQFEIVGAKDGSPPVFDSSMPCGGTLPATESVPIEIPILVTDEDEDDVVTLTVVGLPPGSTVTPEPPLSGNPVSALFSWVPTPDQVGVYVVQFIAEDTQGHQSFCHVTLTVGVCFLMLGFQQADWEMLPGDHLLTIPATWFPVTMTRIPVFNIPSDERLSGFELYFQVYMNNPAAFPSDEVQLSNGVRVILDGEATEYGPSSGMSLWLGSSPDLGGVLDFAFSID